MSRDRASAPLPGAFLLLLAGLSYGVVSQGGYRSRQFVPMAAVIGAGFFVALTRRFANSKPRAGRQHDWMLGTAAGAFAAPVVLSGLVTGAAASAITARLALAGIVMAGLWIGSTVSPTARGLSVDCLTAIALGTAATGWWGAFTRREPWGFLADGLWRASSTLTYPNAAACLVGMLLIVNLARLTELGTEEPGGHTRRRALACYLLAVGLVATQSRAGVGAVAVGVVVTAHVVGYRRAARAWWPIAVATVVGGITILARSPLDNPAAPSWAVAGALAGTGLVLVLARPGTGASQGDQQGRADKATGAHRVGHARRPAVVAAAVVVMVMALGGVAVAAQSDRFNHVVRSRVSLSSPVAGGDATGERPFLGDRGRMWRAAWEEFIDAPLVGQGPGNVSLTWTGSDGATYVGWYAHNEFLELAASLGLLGIAGLVGAVVLVSRWARRTARAAHAAQATRAIRAPADRALRAGVIGALVAFGLHSGTDFLWRLPVLPLTVATLVGLGWGSRSADRPSGPLARHPELSCPTSPAAGPAPPLPQPS